jgi:PAS domain S-box-containing protein
MDADRNLLFGVLAVQADLIDAAQFIEACLLWTTRKQQSLADLLIERGWIEPADRQHVDYLLERKLGKHRGDIHASLAALPDDVKRSLAALGDADIERSLATLPPSAEVLTVSYVPGATEHYCRLRLHATGGIGRIWLAQDNHLGRQVALKELRPERAGQGTNAVRFLQEAQITGQLEHPGVVPVYELVRGEDGKAFYTMRFVKGRTLSQAAHAFHEKRLANQEDPLALPALLSAFATVCNTVAYAHSRGVIHRDLKGQNVVLGDFGEVVVLDWGLAKLVGRPAGAAEEASVIVDGGDSGFTVQGQALGTPAYMAPEQSSGSLGLIDQRSDVYGLGAMLYEILTGAPPFSGASTDEVLRKVREEEPVPPRSVWPGVPPALEALCLRALSKAPADRPATAGELAQEVQGWQERERRKAEEALRESEALYHSLVECLPCVVVRKDLEGRFTFANPCFGELIGRPADQALGQTDFDYFPAALAEKYRTDDRHVLETGGVLEVIDEVPGEAGPRYFHVLKTAVRHAAGQVMGIQLIGWEVTDRKRAEEELRKSRERFELAVLASQDGLLDWDIDADQVWYSPQMRAMLGYSEEEFPNRRFETEKRVHPDDQARRLAAVHGLVAGTTDHLELEYRVLHKDGSYHWVRDRVVALRRADGKAYRLAGSREDITARKRSEDELRKSQERFQLVVQGSQDGLWDWDPTIDEVYYSPRYKAMLGYADDEFPNRREEWARRIHPEDQDRVRAELQAEDEGHESLSWTEFRMRHKDGSYRWIRSRAFILRDAAGRVRRKAGSFEDITDRKTAEEALRQSEERYRSVIAAMQDGIVLVNADGSIRECNAAAERILGLSAGQIMGRTPHDPRWRAILEDGSPVPSDTNPAMETLRTGRPCMDKVMGVHKPDGTLTWVTVNAQPLFEADGRTLAGVAASFEDITERKRLEEKLRRAEAELSRCNGSS